MRRFGYWLLLLIYSCLWQIIFAALRILSLVSPSLRENLRERVPSRKQLSAIAAARPVDKKRIVFFCSSAGEYEQARPILSRCRSNGSIDVVFLFFSISAYRFAKARGETALFFKSPPDTLWHWRRLLKALKPDVLLVVRHELWPSFLWQSRRMGARLLLIDATETPSLSKRTMAKIAKTTLLRFFDGIYVVSPKDAQFYQHELGVEKAVIKVAGDTKYDRARERVSETQDASSRLFTDWNRFFGERRRLIVGSAWHADINCVMQAYKELVAEGKLTGWQLVIAPHDISARMVNWIDRRCGQLDLPSLRYTEIGSGLSGHLAAPPVVIVDKMGLLAELYGLGRLAFVGGALHHKVHNVLEPACRGLYVTCGPNYKNSREARMFVEAGLLELVTKVEDLKAWWVKHLIYDGPNVDMLEFVGRHCGASDVIFADLMAHTQNPGS